MIPVRISNPMKSMIHLNIKGIVPFFNNLNPIELFTARTIREKLLWGLDTRNY